MKSEQRGRKIQPRNKERHTLYHSSNIFREIKFRKYMCVKASKITAKRYKIQIRI